MTSKSSTASPNGKPSRLVRVRRKPDRARYDMPAVHAVLDAAPLCHVATIRDGRPVVLPMAYGRLGDILIFHGSTAAGLFRDFGTRSPVCVTATLFDGLVLTRSSREQTMNYRSVTIHGHATPVTEPDEILAGLQALVEHLAPGRWEQARKPYAAELREVALWQVPIDDASVKSRSGYLGGDPESEHDRALPVWAGHIPAQLVFGEPVPAADGLPPGIQLPGYVRDLPATVRPADLRVVPST
jgi:nitroimidazol reductase NimA-like FMN-containing flavoprotein (pyridoxamine 5'-phosphate oxidase superfamily)